MQRSIFFIVLTAIPIFWVGCSKSAPRSTTNSSTTASRPESSSKSGYPDIPEFQWPPPQPSVLTKIPSRYLVEEKCKTQLRDVSDRLEEALNQAGYQKLGWYSIPNGFAIVTRLERINTNGTPHSSERWSEGFNAPRSFSIVNYIRSLYTAKTGLYRVLVFIVTDNYSEPSSSQTDEATAKGWYQEGEAQLPKSIGRREFSTNYYCMALIYEFEQTSGDEPATFKASSKIQGEKHLAVVLNALRRGHE